MKAQQAQSLTIGWQAERFHRTKNIQTPDYWLKPRNTDPDAGAADLRAMIGRIKAKQEGGDGRHG